MTAPPPKPAPRARLTKADAPGWPSRHEAREVAIALLAAGRPPELPVAIVESASLDSLRSFTTLGELAREGLNVGRGPTIMLFGEVFRAALKSARVHEAVLARGVAG